ncbi:MAG: 16S rRNA (adenine(1518)-N(6)/adenine(1519)-N(6))-dimethyltransferase RsmA [Candidatus Scalinduaceae bacterium]
MLILNGPHTKTMLKAIFDQRGIRLRKQWGQNFLIDQNILQFIVKSAGLSHNDVILEIGAGTGSLTRMLAEKAGHVFAVEMDYKISEILAETLRNFKNVSLINKDILKSKHHIHPEIVECISNYVHTAPPVGGAVCIKVISNLPYYISTPVIIDLLQEELPIKLMVLTLQRDITNRIVANPGTKDYGLLSIMTKLFANVKILKKLPPDVFWPPPLVNSAIVKIELNRNKYSDRIHNYGRLKDVIKSIYTSRRKTILNNLLSLNSSADIKKEAQEIRNDLLNILKKVGIEPGSRGEELDLEKLIELSNEI